MAASRASLPGARWHFQHGPMDIVIGAEGEARAVAEAHEAAWSRFEPLLDELVGELALLRRPLRADAACVDNPLAGETARRMWHAAWPHRARFVTPMVAVAGAVAETLIAAYRRRGIARAWVNNGGDIALYLAEGASVSVGVFGDLSRLAALDPRRAPALDARLRIESGQPVRGIATSGWQGRSFSLGIADSVTVLARSAALADAAATFIANAVDADDPGIQRRPAASLKDDSDLGELPVTTFVPTLATATVQAALSAGLACAESLRAAGLVHGALLLCQGQARVCGDGPLPGLAAGGARAAATAEVGSVFA